MSRESERASGLSLDAEGAAAPPRANGELVFEAPWESRAFGVTLTLCERGAFSWERFREHLIAEIARWERAHPPGTPYRYYERWLAALERVSDETGLCNAADLDDRIAAYAARPHGHDH